MSDTIRTSLTAGDLLGRYRIVRQIGAGGMSSVYEAEHIDLGKRVAVKALLPHFEGSEEVRIRMLREGKAASAIRHPHVVDISDVGVYEGITFLVMELLQGEDLSGRLRRLGALEVAETADILVPVMAGLAAAHAVGVLHRDLKPGNIFITTGPYGEEVPKLVDFGIAKDLTLSEAKPLTETGRVVGTPYYMSPEQVTASAKLDGRSDVYSMGVILYHCLCGQAPFRGESLYTVMTDVVQGDFESIDTVRPDLPAKLRKLVMTAMATSPEDRWPTVSRLGLEVAAFASERVRAQWSPIFASVSQTPKKADLVAAPAEAALQTGNLTAGFDIPSAELQPKRRRGTWASLLVLLALLGAGAWWSTSRGSVESESMPVEATAPEPALRALPPIQAEKPGTAIAPPAPDAEELVTETEASIDAKPKARRKARRRRGRRSETEQVGEALQSEPQAPRVEPKKVETKTKKDVELGTNDAPILK
ncbi:MAG: protein kinase [Myxococcota bacterium]